MSPAERIDASTIPCLVAGDWVEGTVGFDVLNKFSQAPIASVAAADEAMVSRAVDGAVAAVLLMPGARERGAILARASALVAERRDAFRDAMVAEAGFPLRDAEGEIARAIETLALSGEEARRLGGEAVPFAGTPGGAGRIGFTLRVPLGVVAAITPFNAPLNTPCHKVGPALAAGNAVVLKPSDRTPLTADLLARALLDAELPPAALSVLHGGAEVARMLLADERIAHYAFTGSTAAGRAIQAQAGVRRTQMELGSIAATIVLADADLDLAATKCAGAGFRKAGQVCTSIQMLMVADEVYGDFRERLLARVSKLRAGDPSDPATDVGPLISPDAAQRVERTIRESGGTVALGGTRKGAVVAPTVLEDVARDAAIHTADEIFGPVVSLIRVADLDEATGRVNATPYGLATGVFTRDIASAFRAARRIEVGGVHVNETSSSRVDAMPYGGVKASGHGREGPAHAVREMSAERLVTFSGLDPA